MSANQITLDIPVKRIRKEIDELINNGYNVDESLFNSKRTIIVYKNNKKYIIRYPNGYPFRNMIINNIRQTKSFPITHVLYILERGPQNCELCDLSEQCNHNNL